MNLTYDWMCTNLNKKAPCTTTMDEPIYLNKTENVTIPKK